MTPVNRGKQFEEVIRKCFEKIGASVDRLHDQTNGFSGSSNIADFIVYHYPFEYYIECKAIHGNTLSIHSNDPKQPYGLIRKKQWEGMAEKVKTYGVYAGVICWWVDHDVTRFIPIQTLQKMREFDFKSVRYDMDVYQGERTYLINGKKNRVTFTYDMYDLFHRLNKVDVKW